MDKNIPLSELIRIGCKASRVQCNRLYERTTRATCAIGAAHLAKTGELVPELDSSIARDNETYAAFRACGVDPEKLVNHPKYDEAREIAYVVISLNDIYGWSRQRIADWLESIGM